MNPHPTAPEATLSSTTALRFDVVAGLTAASVVLPKAMAYATVAGLPVGGGITASWFFGLQGQGVLAVGLITQGFPSLTLPDLALIDQLVPGALGIALMSFTESIAAGRAFLDSAEPPINPNRELIALGAANLGGAMFGAMPAGGGATQTAVVRAADGRSQIVSLITASMAGSTMLLLAPLLGLLPLATLAAVVIVYSVGLIQPMEFLAIRKVRTMEFRWAIVACLGVLLFGTLQDIKEVCLENSCQNQPEAIEEVCRILMEEIITNPKAVRGITKEKNQFSL